MKIIVVDDAFIGAQALSLLKPAAYLINTAPQRFDRDKCAARRTSHLTYAMVDLD